MNKQTGKLLLLAEVLPAFSAELRQLLVEQGEPELASQVSALTIFDRCRCGDDICCSTFYTQPKASFGQRPRNIRLYPSDGAFLVLDVLGGKIACVELLDRPQVREKLLAAVP
jgi:hypothetical protein